MVKIVSNINAGSGLEWSLEVIINVVDLGGHTSVTSSDDSIRPTLTYDEHGYKQRNLEEAKRYYSILAKGAAKYIKQKELELGSEAVAYIETQNSEESGAGYVFFTVDDQAFSVDLRVAEVQYSDKRNMAREDWAIKKLNRYKSQGVISKDSTLVLEDIIIQTEDGKREFDEYSSAIEYMKSKIDELLSQLLT